MPFMSWMNRSRPKYVNLQAAKQLTNASHSPNRQKQRLHKKETKSFQVQTNVRVYAQQPASATGRRIGTPIIRVDVEKTPVKELGIVKMIHIHSNFLKYRRIS
ncbi:hypothetical protein ACH95_12690 [Bacillus glycinifermentans]|uniref:Uncharacterized protein n=1 Tax=Bacillus glycinifermentans TaxID=1664069 RepID=A0A0J6EP24_9BACI|nr:hypothetical protein ACH95_12690 [Bacillus glycinifermentans]KRT95176.1 hypothetical protein AB447_211730 [Bacillus glycinifermentans]